MEPHGRVEPDGPTSVVYIPPDGASRTYGSVELAYEALRDVDVEFSGSLVEREGKRGLGITFPSGRDGFRTVWFARNDVLNLKRLLDDYRGSLACAEDYRRAGDSDFLTAFEYVDTHPAFWIHREADSRRGRWYWETSGHMNRVHLGVWRGDDGVRFDLETGAHTPDMTEHFYDPYLDAVGATFEAAVLELARNVSVRFHDDGSETGEKPSNPQADELIAIIKGRTGDRDQTEGSGSR